MQYGRLFTPAATRLAIYYLRKNSSPQDLKSLVLIGSLGTTLHLHYILGSVGLNYVSPKASWIAFPIGTPLYTASKHAILGTMRALSSSLAGEPSAHHIRLSCIHPWFVDTTLVDLPTRLVLSGLPLTSAERIALAVFNSATDPDARTSGSAYMLLDDGPVVRLEKEMLRKGVYEVMGSRVQWIQRCVCSNLFTIVWDYRTVAVVQYTLLTMSMDRNGLQCDTKQVCMGNPAGREEFIRMEAPARCCCPAIVSVIGVRETRFEAGHNVIMRGGASE